MNSGKETLLKKLLVDAISYANDKFRGIDDKAGRPYILHCLGAMNNVRKADHFDYEGMIVAVLHDVVEDTDTKIEEIVIRFGGRAGAAVHAITKKDDETRNDYLLRVMEDPIAVRAKIGDMEDNLNRSGGSESLNEHYRKWLPLLRAKSAEYEVNSDVGTTFGLPSVPAT